MKILRELILEDTGCTGLVAGLEARKGPVVVSGLSEVHKSHLVSALRSKTGRHVLVVCNDTRVSERVSCDISCLTGEPVYTLSEREFVFYSIETVSRGEEQARLRTLTALSEDRAGIVVATIPGILQRTIPKEYLSSAVLELDISGHYDMSDVVACLERLGYKRSEQVEGAGQYAVRGGILDFYTPSESEPVRCEFFGDEIDSMSHFDIESQRRGESINTVRVLPVAETLPSLYSDGGVAGFVTELRTLLDRVRNSQLRSNIERDIERLENLRSLPQADKYIELIYPMSTALDYMHPDTIVVIYEPLRVTERAEGYLHNLSEEVTGLLEKGELESGLVRYAESYESTMSALNCYSVVFTDSYAGTRYPLEIKRQYNITSKQLSSYGGSQETAVQDIEHYMKTANRTYLLCHDKRRAESMQEFLNGRGIGAGLDYSLETQAGHGECVIGVGSLSAGMEYPGLKAAVITEGQMLGISEPVRRHRRRKSNRERLVSYSDLSPGDLVVHEHHGIGRFVGIQKLVVDGIKKDYVKISYSGSDNLYVPATQLDLVSKYIGSGESTPVKLSKMGGVEWTKTKSRAKKAAKEMAQSLTALYAERERSLGHAFSQDSVWQTEFEERFGYEETDDQLRSIIEIKRDMERKVPMDRLLCGDVGYGKTEVALRAVMKCVLDGYQAAILVPTTVLAQQHFVTSVRRFAGFPVNIEVLSRFRTPGQIKKALSDIERGAVDIVIGTHRLIQKDVKFKKLGLLIIDEEQRFGVAHKERLKEITKRVDVLTLSATPIPRTLNMALSGIRDMSTIESPPRNRQPVTTLVLEHRWEVICEAIRREASRGGQVYYIHNRIENIERTAVRLSEMLEGITVAVAHGQMDEESLSGVMERMIEGEITVLVCTTIIETGIDIPNVNTLIIEDADKLGLSQLHQIRGRVGRSQRRAYAYLTFREGKVLSEIAEKRLGAIREFAEFNSGFKIAMRDLEIRGAGSLLGAEQSGHLISVGYDMYLKLLEEAVLEERGEKSQRRSECSADLSVSALIPESYVESTNQRMDLYRRIAGIRSDEDKDEMIAELIDRYGEPPDTVITLITIALMRSVAAQLGISEITQKDGYLNFKLTEFDPERVSKLYAMTEYKNRVRIKAGADPVITLKLKSGASDKEAIAFVNAFSI